MLKSLARLLLLCSGASASTALEDGYRAMYNLNFAEAHRIFDDCQKLRPQDPFPPVSDAAAHLFSEFDRLRILQAEFFLDDRGFKKAAGIAPDPALKETFEKALAKADGLATAALLKSARDTNALFAKAMIQGLRADYLGLVEKRYLPSLSAMKAGRAYADALLAIDPSFGDAYLAGGVENYILSQKPMPVRWLLQAYGSETDAARGMRSIRMCLEKGLYMKPFARLLLAVAAVREKRYNVAREMLLGLAREFPGNPLYAQQADKLPK